MAEKIQLRRDTAANWASSNPILSQGELGLSVDTQEFKFGDGSTPWNAVAPWTPSTIKGAEKLVSIGDHGWGYGQISWTASTAGTSEYVFTVGVAATCVTAMWTHFYNNATITTPYFGDVDPAGGAITFKASLQVVSSSNPGTTTGTLYRLTFGGRISVTLDPGGRITADPLGLSVAPGDIVAVRTYLSAGTAYAPRAVYPTAAWGGFTATTDLTPPGSAAVATPGGTFYGPAVLLGQAQGSSSAKSILLLGDSVSFGSSDFNTGFITPSLNQGGFAVRALTGVGGLVNIAIGGDSAANFQTTTGSFRRLPAAQLCNTAILQYGTNDFFNYASTAAQVEASNLNIANNLRRNGISKVFVLTLTPRTTSTDGWATTTNQTPASGDTQRVAYNTWIRAGCPIDPTTKAAVAAGTSGALLAGSYGHPFTGFFDTVAVVESALNSGRWAAASRVATGSMTSGSKNLTSSDANFQSALQESGGDRGIGITIMGAGAAGVVLGSEIFTVSSSTQVAVIDTAATTVSGAQISIGTMTTDGYHPSPHGHYLMARAINTALL